MDKVTTETVKFNRLKHNFYCDECGEFLGSAVECEDGYYPDPKELVELKIYISS